MSHVTSRKRQNDQVIARKLVTQNLKVKTPMPGKIHGHRTCSGLGLTDVLCRSHSFINKDDFISTRH